MQAQGYPSIIKTGKTCVKDLRPTKPVKHNYAQHKIHTAYIVALQLYLLNVSIVPELKTVIIGGCTGATKSL